MVKPDWCGMWAVDTPETLWPARCSTDIQSRDGEREAKVAAGEHAREGSMKSQRAASSEKI